jgi:hypothetical protein
MLHRCKAFVEYLDIVTKQASKYGREGLKAYSERIGLLIGFETPDGIFALTLGTIKNTFTGPWRENTSLNEMYYKCGGKTPISCMTRTLPESVFIPMYQGMVAQAIDKGIDGTCIDS